MTAIYLESTRKKPNCRFWNYIKNYDINYSKIHFYNESNENLEKDSYQNSIGISNSVFITDGKNIYAFSSINSNSYSVKTNAYVNFKNNLAKVTLTKIADIQEFNISVFSVKYSDRILNYCINYDQISTELYNGTNLVIKECTLVDKKLNIINHVGVLNKIIFENVTSRLLVDIPILSIELRDKGKNNLLNGSPIYDNQNNFIGIVSDYRDSIGNFYGIPAYCIKYIIDLINDGADLSNLKSIMIKTDNIYFEDRHQHGLYVKDNCQIKYNDVSIPENSIIYKVNNKEINNDGCMYCDKLKYWIPIQTYILLHNEIKSFSFKVIYNNEKKLKKKKEIIPCSYKSYLSIPINSNYICYIIKGLVFMELSIEYLESIPHYVNIEGEIKEAYNTKYNNLQKKKVVLVDTLYGNIPQKYEDLYKLNNLPSIQDNDKFNIVILKKINDKYIKSIEDLCDENIVNNLLTGGKFNILMINDKNITIKIKIN